MIATQTPGFHTDFPELDGNGILDKDVTAGTTYSYHVTAIGPGDARTEVGDVATMLSTSTTPTPTFTLDSTQASDLKSWTESTVIPFLEAWYPKVGDAIAQPDYVPPPSIKLRYDTSYTGVAYESNLEIVMNPAYARMHEEDLGAWLHESTHAIQGLSGYANAPSWVTEGVADTSRDVILHDRESTADLGSSYEDGYSSAAVFLRWMQETYDATLIHELNVLAHDNNYADSFFVQKTGMGLDDLWMTMTGSALPSPKPFAALANRCLQSGGGSPKWDVEIATCSATSTAQNWGVAHNSDGTLSIGNQGSCIDAYGDASASLSVSLYGCTGSATQRWQQQADGSLKSPSTGKCLEAPSSTSGTSLRLATCSGTNQQKLAPL